VVDEEYTFEVAATEAGMRLDRWLTLREPTLGRRRAKDLCDEGRVFVDGHRAFKAMPLPEGARVSFPAPVPRHAAANPELPLDVRFENEHCVVVHKPAGQPTAPLDARENTTLANALLGHYPQMGAVGSNPLEPGLIHRLDNGTSGLLVAAKSQWAFDALKSALARGTIDKQYLAVVVDTELPDQGRIDVALEPSPHNPRRVIAARSRSGGAREAQTTYVVIERQLGLALVSATAKRALRHQIRAHFASIACPLANDEAYGGPRVEALAQGRHALHARRVAWAGNGVMAGFDVVAEVPADLEIWLSHSGFRLIHSIE